MVKKVLLIFKSLNITRCGPSYPLKVKDLNFFAENNDMKILSSWGKKLRKLKICDCTSSIFPLSSLSSINSNNKNLLKTPKEFAEKTLVKTLKSCNSTDCTISLNSRSNT